jgi:hypothetical protein
MATTIEFIAAEDDYQVIPEPYPARKLIPDWYKKLDNKLSKGFESSTIKRCPPFLDIMQMGWIIPLAADVYFKVNEDCSGIEYEWKYHKNLVENHGLDQLSGVVKHPSHPVPPLKFLNYWQIKVKPGWSVCFVPPFNRADPRFECVSGLVDCDKYPEYINFPFIWKEPNFEGILKAGTPLVQVIPVPRKVLKKDFKCRRQSKKELDDLQKVRRKRSSYESLYRDKLWVKK